MSKQRQTFSKALHSVSVDHAAFHPSIASFIDLWRPRSVIIKGNKDFTKEHLERLVVQHGGDYCQAQLADGSAMVISSSEKSRLALGTRTPSGIDHCPL
jgi:hypothetical protein